MSDPIKFPSGVLTKMDSLPGRPENFKVLYRVVGVFGTLPTEGKIFWMHPTEGEWKGGYFHTSLVTRIISNIEGCIRFETMNSVYKLVVNE
jgi:hypothetical protein